MRRCVAIGFMSALIWFIGYAPAFAQSANTCIRTFLQQGATGRPQAVNAATEAYEQVIKNIARKVGLTQTITVVHCDFSTKVEAFYANGQMNGVPAGQYVIYNPDWLREVIGTDNAQAIVIFGHEFGHFANSHFQDFNKPTSEKELEADKFSGCAAARMKIKMSVLDDVLGRLRRDESSAKYAGREISLSAAKQGFTDCGGLRVCRLPQNGMDYWGFEQSFRRELNWRGGGGNQQSYCDEMSSQLRGEFPQAVEFERISSTERTRDNCQPLRCIQYKYVCQIVVRSDPVFKEAEFADCP